MANNNDKNFEQFLANPTNYSDYKSPRKSIDPNLFANKELQHQIVKDSQKQYVVNLIKSAILSVVVAPLTTIHTSLQLSVIPHQNKYGDIPNPTQPSTTALTKTTKDIKPHDKRKFELLIKSGAVGNNKPFRAPVYISYYEAIKGLSNQGFLGFYKGNMLGLFYFAVNSNLKLQFLSQMDFGMSNVWHQGNQFIRQCIVLSLCSFAEIITNPIMLFQSRFILQNRLPNFYLYKSFPAAIKKHLMNKREYFKGASTHIYKNISIFLLQMPINWSTQLENYSMLYLVLSSHIFGYPWLTVQRRLQCQSHLPGMIPVRYSGPWHAMRLIVQEEGLKGLYRGFIGFSIATGLLQYTMVYSGVDQGDLN